MSLPITNQVNSDITPKPHVQFGEEGKDFGFLVVDPTKGLEFQLRKGQIAVANGDLNVVLYEVDKSDPNNVLVGEPVILMTEAELRRDFDGVPD